MWPRQLLRITNYKSKFGRFVNYGSQALSAKSLPEDASFEINNLKIGSITHGFEVLHIESVKEFNITAVRLLHRRTKSEYLHLYRNDNNNVFSINFRTTPLNSTGLPHVLEHLVLCGSKSYPVRDPFFKMLNRSLATFMNAMTGSDYTMYPFSTQNAADYRNLQKIYLDAVFHPNLKELDFMQEGWRLEHTDPNNIKSDLLIKGVVYNEMKGAFSENEYVLSQKLQNMILPDHTYGVISGGDPLKIPDLTWQDLKQFHKTFYHPSNARFYSYGNFSLLSSLDFLNTEYLAHYNFQDPSHTLVPQQKRWAVPMRHHVEGRFENMREPFEKQNTISISLLMSDITNIYDTFVLQFISELLIKGPNSPFYKSMIEPNFSGGFTPSTGYDSQPRDSIFTLGLQGLSKNDYDTVITIFDSTIDDVINNGFEDLHIESVLHGYELGMKHETANFGLNLLFGITPTWNHNAPVLDALKVNNLIGKLREKIALDKTYLQKIVKQYFKENRHRLILTMSPDMEHEKKQLALEMQLFQAKTKNLTDNDMTTIYEKCQELLKEQNTSQNTDLLPTLQIDDIRSDVDQTPYDEGWVGPVFTQFNKVNTNGITYFKGILNTSHLTPEQQMLLPLMCNVITKLGTNTLNYRQFDALANRKTAGLNLSVHLAESLYQLNSYEPGILLSSHCLDENVESMWDLWNQVFNISGLKDNKRFEMLVQLYMANLSHGVADAGHLYAMLAASSLVSGAAYQKELLTGLQHISYMKSLMKISKYEVILAEIANIMKMLFNKNNLRCSLNFAEEMRSKGYTSYEHFIENLPGNTLTKSNEHSYTTNKVWSPTDSIHCNHHVLTVPVYYCSKAILTAPYTDKDYAKLRVLARLLSAKYLHPELREKQGAYGGGARLTTDGVFTFYSYRDPRHLQTLDIFDNSYKWLLSHLNDITAQEVLEAKLGVFQSVDAPVPPSGKGADEFLRGLKADIVQRHRAEIMTVDHNSIKTVIDKYLGENSNSLCGKVILGPKSSALNMSNRVGELWTVVDSE